MPESSPKSRIRILVAFLILIAGYAIFLQYYNYNPGFNDATLADLRKENAAKIVDIAKSEYDIDLDYSPESIKKVDQILGQMHREHLEKPFSEDQVIKRSILWGSYVGEVVRSNVSCEWRATIGLPLQLDDETYLYPTDWCHQKIVDGGEENHLWTRYLFATTGN
ncbi:hypothetical protein [Gimesia maris]|uniref:hypothetical protein n=1 Tax=Gimesia maris TaxID=122 RepID=UPI0032ED837D